MEIALNLAHIHDPTTHSMRKKREREGEVLIVVNLEVGGGVDVIKALELIILVDDRV